MRRTVTLQWILFVAPDGRRLTCFKLYWTVQIVIARDDPAVIDRKVAIFLPRDEARP